MSTRNDIRDWVRLRLGEILGTPGESIVLDKSLYDYGLDSVDGVLLAGELEERFGVEIDPAAFLAHPTFEEMIAALETGSS